jgi:hypothetical protein
LNASADWWRETLGPDRDGAAALLQDSGAAFREATYAFSAGYGLGRGWEIGVTIPLAIARLEPRADPARAPEHSIRSSGLGGIGVQVARGWSAAAGTRNLIAVLGATLPSDTRAAEVRASGEARLTLTAERYWDRIGLVGSFGTTIRAGEEAAGDRLTASFSGGVGLQVTDAIYGSAHLRSEEGTPWIEASSEILLKDDTSVELFIGRDVAGSGDVSFFGIALNVWIDFSQLTP